AAGYEVGRTSWLERDAQVWATAAGGLLVLVLIAVLAQATGIAGLASGAGTLSNGGVVVALLLGLAAGVSTCMALVGGVVLALSAANETRRSATAGDVGIVERLRPGLVFVGGRIAGYAVLGAALGALGSSISLPTRFVAVLMIAVAIVMTLIGIRLTGLSPRVAAWSPTLPAGLAGRLGLGSGSVTGYSDTRAALLGAASFFLPCGFTQAVQIYALSTGSPVIAGVIMAVFAIGTAPGLLALAGLPAIMPDRARPTLLRVIGVVVIGFAFVNAGAGLRLAGFALPSVGPSVALAAALPPVANSADGRQTLYTFQDAGGYRPGNVAIHAGTPTRWVITSLDSQSCATFLRIPGLDMAVTLHTGRNVIDLPAMPAGSLSYACAMGMYGGTITILDPPAGAVGATNGG
ncbi:MAG TPA: sulfite exporter TauE/SafE family protein, partial [Candidatus Limnocylindrales bacterium]|nr:sulfite exporter TauE/SafE family protein [Candidatus Limnocylindrales bacterium]